MERIDFDMELVIDGMGIVLYSPGMVEAVPVGSDFLDCEFSAPEDVGRHVRKGDVTGFCTGTSGVFELKFREGYPDETVDRDYPVSIRLGIQVKGGEIRVVDLFWLSEFDPDCPEEQTLKVEDGFYHVTVNTRKPDSGIWGDRQTIFVFLEQVDRMPELAWQGVPYLFSN